MSTAAIAASAVVINSNNAAMNARKKRECEVYVEGYEHQDATVLEMQEYAQCIDRLHPKEMSQDSQEVLAWLFLISIVIGVMTGIITWKRESFGDACLMTILAILGTWLAYLLIVLAYAACKVIV